MSYIGKCAHGILMNMPCKKCAALDDMKPERVGPHDPAGWRR
jgi:hypothetical protein